MNRSRALKQLATGSLVAAAYVVFGKLGLQLAYINPSATLVWPATGLALTALLVFGYGIWPAIFVGAFLVNVTTAGTLATSFGIASGNTLEGLAGAWLVNRFANGRKLLGRVETIIAFALLAATVSTAVSATVGVLTLFFGGLVSGAGAGSAWVTWWLGDAAGAVVVTPVLLAWTQRPPPSMEARRDVELVALFAGLLVAGLTVFAGLRLFPTSGAPIGFVCTPFLIWAACRFGVRSAASATVLLSAIAIWGTLDGHGPFVRATPNASLLMLQSYLTVTSLMTLMLAAAIAERRNIEAQLRGLATIDPLTGIGNHRLLLARLEAEIGRSARNGRPFTFLFLDVDGLKAINDRHGHLVGTEALRRVAHVLRDSSRTSDTAARYGGDEFALLLPETGAAAAELVVRRIRESLIADPATPPVRATIGVAEYPRDGRTPNALIEVADRRLYDGKPGRHLPAAAPAPEPEPPRTS